MFSLFCGCLIYFYKHSFFCERFRWYWIPFIIIFTVLTNFIPDYVFMIIFAFFVNVFAVLRLHFFVFTIVFDVLLFLFVLTIFFFLPTLFFSIFLRMICFFLQLFSLFFVCFIGIVVEVDFIEGVTEADIVETTVRDNREITNSHSLNYNRKVIIHKQVVPAVRNLNNRLHKPPVSCFTFNTNN